MNSFLLVAVGGAIGASARHGVSLLALRTLGPGWPWGTFAANLIGSFLMGCLIGWLAFKVDGGRDMRLLLGTGILGGFTTFSAFSLETFQMIERKAHLQAASYALGSIVAGVLCLLVGLALARRVFA